MPQDTFDVLILIARPASGKSEVIAFLRQAPPQNLTTRYRVGPFREVDDFPMLWTWFEEDDIRQELGLERVQSTPDRYFLDDRQWQVLIRRINGVYAKWLRDRPDLHEQETVLVEFSRGAAHGGYREAFQHLSDDILRRGAVLYIEVSFEESLAKDQRRYNPDRPDSVLQHGLGVEKMEALYKDDDFRDFAGDDPEFLMVRGLRVPYVVFENHDDVTTDKPDQLAERLEARLQTLWELAQRR